MKEYHPFSIDTYIVLNLPEDTAEKVMDIRRNHKDNFRMSLPVEITITGSSGIGVFDVNQDPNNVFEIIEDTMNSFPPFQSKFGGVLRFPYTDIFVFTLQDEEPYKHLHNRLIGSDIKFKSNDFPYKPHCTIRSRSPVTDREVDELFSVSIPEPFFIDTYSVYSLETNSGEVNLKQMSFGKLKG